LAPRPPSAALRARIFGPPAVEPTPFASFAWLAPATACLLLTLGVLVQRNGVTAPTLPDPGVLAAMSLSNQSLAAYLPGSVQHGLNSLRLEPLEWTNGSGATSGPNAVTPLKGSD